MAELHVQRKRNNYIWVWVFLILVLIGVVVYFYMQGNNRKEQLNSGRTRTGMIYPSPGKTYILS
jgi:hypothetical protein